MVYDMHSASKLTQNYQHYLRRSGKRGLKSQGTSKINLNCSVCIKAMRCLKQIQYP